MNDQLSGSPVPPVSAGRAFRQALDTSGGVPGILTAAAPIAGFAIGNSLGGMTWAFIGLAVTSVVVFAVQRARRESLRSAVVGLVVAAVCAAIAAVLGEARAYFLLPTLIPAAMVLLFLGSALARRPVTGVLFNGLVGGPTSWRFRPRLMRVYILTTLAGAVVMALNFALRAVFYAADQTALLAVVLIATIPVMAVLAAITVVAARRVVAPARHSAGA